MRDCCVVLTPSGGFWLINSGNLIDVEEALAEYVEYLNEGYEPMCLNEPTYLKTRSTEK